jgi:hypothetical protein
MDDTITTIYCLCEEFLKAIGHRDDPQVRLSSAEVMTVALTASAFFGSNIEHSRLFLNEHGYMPKMISKSRLNRRLHAIPLSHWEALFGILAAFFKERNCRGEYVVDSFPIPVCDNILRSGAVGSTRAKSSGDTSPPRSDTSTVCGCI